ncbi:MAG: carboxypeptidase regulatory-like domain-containing protein [Saprospiraceae bacterium]|nr:carboxypeptidase regulatory-like domain-containing protein [Saprospiraceae bacterium]
MCSTWQWSGQQLRTRLYNKAELDRTGDGITDVTDDACGDLPGAIGDFVWEDLNLNGIQDPGEPGIRNVLVRLRNQSNVIIRSTITDANGFYLFDNLPAGIYSVQFTTPVGYIPTLQDQGADDSKDSDPDPNTGITVQYTLAPGQTNLTIDAGYYRLGRIGDFVWEDLDSDGIQDAGEPGIPNVTVILTGTDALGNPVNQSTTTNAMGMYEFINLVPGTYTVTFVRPGSNYLSSPANVGLNDAVDSDANEVTGATAPFFLSSNENNTTVDAGFYRCAKVGDFVWLDTGTQENIQDAGDIGLNNITVELYLASNPSTPIETQVTRNSPIDGRPGYYLFECVKPGVYFIKVRKPEDYDFVVPNFGSDDMIDSDIVDFINQSTLNFTVNYAQIILDIDIGFKFKVLPVQLEDFTGKWNTTRDVNELDWVTASELNNDYFEIERSFAGSNFEVIGRVDGKGNSTVRSFYGFDDSNISQNGVYSYRLKQVDADGKFSYSKTVDILVNRRLATSARIYPNPANSFVNVNITGSEGAKVEMDVYDNNGRLILKGLMNTLMDADRLDTVIPLDRLDPGVYMLRFRVDADIFNQKLIIVR